MTTQRQRDYILELLKKAGVKGVNSYDLTYKHSIKQAPTRIHELKELGYVIKSKKKSNRSVDYILLHQTEASKVTTKPQYEPPKILQPWEKPCISYEKDGRTFWKYFESEEEKAAYLAPKQESLAL